jgi:hypothetical protein
MTEYHSLQVKLIKAHADLQTELKALVSRQLIDLDKFSGMPVTALRNLVVAQIEAQQKLAEIHTALIDADCEAIQIDNDRLRAERTGKPVIN